MNMRKGAAYMFFYIGFLLGLFGLAVWLPTTGLPFHVFMMGLGGLFGLIGLALMLWRAKE